MICTMKLHTPAQLDKYKKTLYLFFLAFTLSVIFNMVLFGTLYLESPSDFSADDVVRTNFNLNARELFRYCWKDTLNISDTGIVIIDYTYILLFQMHIFDIFIAATFIFIKPRQDILTGCSKLGDLLKVSVFQVYKNKDLQKHKDSIRGLHDFLDERMQVTMTEYSNHTS